MPASASKRPPASRRPTVRREPADPDGVYASLIEAVVDQRLPPGMHLNELALCDVYGIARRVIERILARMTFEGVAVSIANRGSFVASPDAQEARAIFAARKAIESGTVELASMRASGADFRTLERNIAEEDEHRNAGRMREAIRLSGRFHVLLSEVAGNAILGDQVRLLVARTSLVTSLYENATQMGCWHDDHARLIGHMRAHRTRRAVEVMRTHLDALEESLDLDRKNSPRSDLRAILKPAQG